MERGLQQGLAKGLEQGRTEGRQEGINEMILSFLKENIPMETIAKAAKVSLDYVREVAARGAVQP